MTSTANGREFENIIANNLQIKGIVFSEQPPYFPKRISITVTPDFEIKNKNNNSLFVFAQQDFWNGGQQSDRFGHVVQMDQFVWNPGEVFYVLRYPGVFKKEPKRWTNKQKLKDKLYKDLEERQVVGSLEQLMERLNGFMSEN